jgi:opacity protein-like surface antigen
MMRLLSCLILALAALVVSAPAHAQGYSPTGTCPTHEWNSAYGSMTASSNCAQPGFGDISGTAAVGQGGTGDTGTAWTSYTPTLTCSSGSVGSATVSGRYKTLGKTTFVWVTVTITSLGTCGTNFYVSVPTTNPVSSLVPLPGYDISAGFIPVTVESSGIIVFAVTPATHQYYANGVYEAS